LAKKSALEPRKGLALLAYADWHAAETFQTY
jgi:hypothetical protein